jgi:anhydro-N-acetylmuramic acid kinase
VQSLLHKAGTTPRQILAIGSHGQTVRHAPRVPEPYTVQLGNPSLLAELTDIVTVADFRRRDMAAGGQGAPLAPAFHAAFFRHSDEARVIVNIGGMANITVLPASPEHPVKGFDTGPGNVLLDAWAKRHLGIPLDQNGAWGGGGQALSDLLDCCLRDPYFALPPPKSTGREYFNLEWLEQKLISWGKTAAPRNVQATLVRLTACTVAADIRRHAPETRRVLICGGGVHNQALMGVLQNQLNPMYVQSTADLKIDPDYLEAIGFAWLAKRTLEGLPGNLPEVTGARGLRILGGVYPAS